MHEVFLNKMNTLYQYCHVCILNKSALRATFIAGHLCEGDLTKYHDKQTFSCTKVIVAIPLPQNSPENKCIKFAARSCNFVSSVKFGIIYFL